MPKTLLIALIALFLLSACAPAAAPAPAPTAPQPTIAPADTVAPADPPTATPEPTAAIAPTDTPAPTPTPAPLVVALDPALPDDLRAAFAATIGAAAGDPALTVAAEGVSGDAAVSLMIESDDGVTLAERFYVAVVPFDMVQDGITFEELKARWAGEGGGPLYVTADSAMLNAIFGDGRGAEVAAEDLPATLQGDRTAIGLIPFDMLDPRYKVLAVDGANVLANTLDPATYPLRARVALDRPGGGNCRPGVGGGDRRRDESRPGKTDDPDHDGRHRHGAQHRARDGRRRCALPDAGDFRHTGRR